MTTPTTTLTEEEYAHYRICWDFLPDHMKESYVRLITRLDAALLEARKADRLRAFRDHWERRHMKDTVTPKFVLAELDDWLLELDAAKEEG